jgi:hypothetical protein
VRLSVETLALAGALLVACASACDGDTETPPPTSSTGGQGGSAGGAAGMGGTAGGGGFVSECVGPSVPREAYAAAPGPLLAMGGAGGMGGGGAGGASLDPTEPGSPAPIYQLLDVQPESCGYGAVYGLGLFKGKVSIAALWAGW